MSYDLEEFKLSIKSLALGGALTYIVMLTCVGPCINESRVFKPEGKPAVIRLYSDYKNMVMVQQTDSTHKDTFYVPLIKYLNANFPDKYDREIERIRIEKIVGW
ncbi:MAG: hypothetical protein AABX29_02095 [Nanoarchaeota archaeon]